MPGMFKQSKETGKGSAEREESDDKFGDGGGGGGDRHVESCRLLYKLSRTAQRKGLWASCRTCVLLFLSLLISITLYRFN